MTEPVNTLISPLTAVVLGIVEGLTEFLPISSTGHLILASDLLGLGAGAADAPETIALQAFEIVIQAGAILAVVVIYREALRKMVLGFLGRDPAGLQLALRLIIAFIPAAILGLSFKKVISHYLQFTGPVLVAMLLGGIFMVLYGRSRAGRGPTEGLGLEDISVRQALLIGVGQALALWPGMSRSMVTIAGGMLVGLSPLAATEFSFLLGLPTLLAATAYKGLKDGPLLMTYVGPEAIAIGLAFSALFAAISIKAMLRYLSRLGLVFFGWYRIVVAALMALYFYGGIA